MLIVADFRNLAKISSYSILSGSIACCYPTETEEIAHRLAKRLYCLRLDYPEASIILADDLAPYWRTAFINAWYSDHGQEPIPYKGNRAGMAWIFKSSREDLDAVYAEVKAQMAAALHCITISDAGLEADDIWGILASSTDGEVLGVSSDSDWRQCCRPADARKGAVTVLDPMTGQLYTDPEDIRPKIAAGDRGDNVLGCPKVLKNGTVKGFWGIDGAKKELAKDPDFLQRLDPDTVHRNAVVITLPCPDWDLDEAAEALELAAVLPKDCAPLPILDRFGLTAPVRKLLSDRAERAAWIAKMRAHLQASNEKAPAPAPELAPAPAPALTPAPASAPAQAPESPRVSRCGQCGRETESGPTLPHFEARPDMPWDRHYCGCEGWN